LPSLEATVPSGSPSLHCPRCGTELKVGEVSADRCGAVVLVCNACDYNILTVS
jgi:transposase-like protein